MNNKKIKTFLIPILSLVIISIIAISSVNTYLNINMFQEYMQKNISTYKKEYLQKQKDMVYKEVHIIENFIQFRINKIENDLKKDLQKRIETSLDIASHIYNTQKGKIPDEQIKKNIAQQLSAIKFNEGRGYYFSYNSKTNIIYGHILKKFIGKDMTNFKDLKGQNLVNLYSKVLKDNEIGFTKIYFRKPSASNKEYPKIVSIAKFEPLDLMIGTGEYLDIVEKRTQKEILDRFKDKELDNKHYMFFYNLHNINGGKDFATILLNPTKQHLLGVKLDDKITDSKGNECRKLYLQDLQKSDDSYTKTWYQTDNSKEHKAKITYLYLQKDWNWILGYGFYFNELEQQVKKMKQSIRKYEEQTIIDLFIWIIVLSVIVVVIAGFISFRIDARYTIELKKQKAQLELAQEVAKMGSWILDMKTNHIFWSDEIYNILEIKDKKDIFAYDDFLALVHSDDKDKLKDIKNKSLDNNIINDLIFRVILSNGDIKWLKEKYQINCDKYKKTLTMSGTIQDITKEYTQNLELEEKRQMLMEKEKLASMGEMIGNIAHQWRQPLSVISTGATGIMLQQELDILDPVDVASVCDKINTQAQYLSKTIDDFTGFIKGDGAKTTFCLNDTIDSFLNLVHSSIVKDNINIVLHRQENITINGYPNELIQCFINLFNNARDEMIKQDIKRYFFINTVQVDNTITITIKDNASGIPTDIIHKVFEPYFTTKHKTQGTGLGLHMTYNLLIESMKGTIVVSNQTYTYDDKEFVGAEFVITLQSK